MDPEVDIEFDEAISRQGSHCYKWEKYKGADIIPMWVADMDIPVAEPIREALKARVTDHPIYGYTAPPEALINALALSMWNKYKWQIAREWLVWLPGLSQGLAAACHAYADPGEEIVIFPPVFHDFYNLPKASGRNLLEVPLINNGTQWTIDVDLFERSVGPKTRMLLLCTPNNPTGTVFESDLIRAILQICKRHNIVVISDEIHSGLVLDPQKQHVPTAMLNHDIGATLVTLSSESKTFNLGGVNCAYAIIDDPDAKRPFVSACESFGIMPMASTFSYEATLAALTLGQEWAAKLRKQLWRNYWVLRSRLDSLQGVRVSSLDATYLAWINVEGLNLDDPHAFFEQAGIGMSSGREFGANGYVRMNFACAPSVLNEALSRMEVAVKELTDVRYGHRSG